MPLFFRGAKQSGKLHVQHFLTKEGAVPFCRDTPFAEFTQEDAEAIKAPGARDELCAKCWRRMPQITRRTLNGLLRD